MDVADTMTAQVAVLGSMLLDDRLVGEVLSKVRDDDFTDNRCRMVFQAIRHIFTEGGVVDPVTVIHRLGGGAADDWRGYMLRLMEETPTAQNIWEYVPIMREQAKVHKIGILASKLLSCYDLEEARKYISQANELLCDRPDIRVMNMEQGLMDFFERNKEKHQYFTWPIERLNEELFVERGDLVVLGGYPSAGKTALALMFAWHMAKSKKVGFFSLETNDRKLHDRLIAANARMSFAKIKRGGLQDEDYEALAAMSKQLIAPQLDLIEASGFSVSDIQAISLSRGYEVIFVDYLQLVRPEYRSKNRENEVSEISRSLQLFAHSTNGPMVCALSQLSRPEKVGENKKAPTMHSFRESGQIEQDADVAFLLYLEDQTNPFGRRVLTIGKNKEGERGDIYLAFDGDLQSFRLSMLEAPAPRQPVRRSPWIPKGGSLPDPDQSELPF